MADAQRAEGERRPIGLVRGHPIRRHVEQLERRALVLGDRAQQRLGLLVAVEMVGEEGLDVRPADVRFGSKGDVRTAQTDVRFTPNSDRDSGLP